MIKKETNHRKAIFIFVLGIAAIFICISNQTACAGTIEAAPDETKNLFFDQSEKGYIQIGSVQVAWGKKDIANLKKKQTAQRVVFPAPFSEIPVVTLGSQQTGGSKFSPYIASVKKGSFTFKAGSPNSKTISWIAIGKWRK